MPVVGWDVGDLAHVSVEPLERELAVQVEYDMDEQGTPMNGRRETYVH